MDSIIKYFIVLIIFLVIDFIWLAFIAKNLYRKYLGYLMKDKPNLLAAFIFYLIFVFGVLLFVINPALAEGSLLSALKRGLLFGLVTYSTYDLTNLATVKNWPIRITIIDLIWGTTVSALTSVLSYLMINAIL